MTRGSVIGFCAGVFCIAGTASATDLYLTASASGADVVPPSASTAVGDVRVIFHDDTGLFDIDVKARGVTAAEITGSSIVLASPGASGPIILDVGASYGSVPDGVEHVLGNQSLPPADMAALLAGGTCFTLRTSTYPSGAIRGQILPLLHKVDHPVFGGSALGHSLVALADGGFVSVWGDDSDGTVAGKRFAADGSAVGGPFVLGSGSIPDVAPLPGGFVAVWLTPAGVVGRRFAATGSPMAPQFTVAPGTISEPPAIAAAPDGHFVVTWLQSNGQIGATRYTGAGFTEFAYSIAFSPTLHAPDVAMAADASFLVTWVDQGSGSRVRALAVDSAGAPIPIIIPVNDGTDPAADPHVAAAANEYVVVWNENGSADRGRRFSTAGTPLAASFPLDVPGSTNYPHVSRAPDGEFVTALQSGADIVVRRFARDGSPAAAESFAAAIHTASNGPEVAIGPHGEAWVSWLDDDESVGADRIPARQAYWSANEGSGVRVGDRAGDADDVGTRMSAAWGNGISGTGLVFNGTDDFVRLFSHSEPEIAGSAITVTAWVKIPALPSGIDEPFHGIYDSAADSYVLYLDKANAELRFKATNANGEAQRPGIPEAMLRLNEWMFIAGVYDGPAGQARIYLDGQLVDTHAFAATGVPVMLPAGVPSIGRDGANYQYYFEGGIDEVEVWDRVVPAAELLATAGRSFDDEFESGNLLAWSGKTT